MSFTSVRPVAASEVEHGDGEPAASFMAFFGFTQGILFHMNYHRVAITSSTWFPTPQSKVFATFFIGGGMIAGRLAGQFMFGNQEL